MMYVGIAFLLISGFYCLFRLHEPFGGRLRGERKQRAEESRNHSGRVFMNLINTPMTMSLGTMASIIRDQMRNRRSRLPARAIEPATPDISVFSRRKGAFVTWLGHSAFIVRLKGKTILFDPMLSRTASPFAAIGPKRFVGTPGLTIDALPPIDAVVISHDHYDHLDHATIKQLATNVKQFFVPLGVGAHLERWGVPTDSIIELDWWDQSTYDDITFVCTPSRHFSGRRLDDRFQTLWASWVVATPSTKLYFSGDTGYGPHFAEIGKRCGPFDLTLLECGQYDRRWPTVHMTPEDTVRAHIDLGGKRMVPMHWGSFVLAIHAWADPVERATAAAHDAKVEICTPMVGETFAVHSKTYPERQWWKAYQ